MTMAKIKIRFRPSLVQGREGAVYYQITHRRVTRQISSGYGIFPREWDSKGAAVVLAGCGSARYDYLASVRLRIFEDVGRIGGIIAALEESGEIFTADMVAELYRRGCADGFMAFARKTVMNLRHEGKLRTAENYTSALNSFARFRGNLGDVPVREVNSALMAAYEDWLSSAGICRNTSSFYMRNLRAIWNRAPECGAGQCGNPFRHVYTGIGKTVKRAVPVNAIRRIRDMSLEGGYGFARDIFMFSFYTRGMSFVDMAYLRKSDLRNGVLSYRRRKTGQRLLIKWERQMQEIVDRYDIPGSPYMLPIIRENGKDAWMQYKNAAHLVNRKLKRVGLRLDIPVPLTTYVARHAWASIAKSKNVPLSVISEAMGHDSENTTRIYLASLDTTDVDKANMIVLKSL